MTKLILIRHAEARGNIDRVFHGHTNGEVTENGLLQLGELSKRMKDVHFDVIYSSDLKRAYDTAVAASAGKDLEIITSENLREIKGGKWEMMHWEEIPKIYPEEYLNWEYYPHLCEIPEGESFLLLQNRVYNEIMSIVKKHIGKTIVVVTHGAALRSVLCKFYGYELSEMDKVKWHDNTSLTIVEFNENLKPTVVTDGDASHLGELSTLEKQDWWKKLKENFK